MWRKSLSTAVLSLASAVKCRDCKVALAFCSLPFVSFFCAPPPQVRRTTTGCDPSATPRPTSSSSVSPSCRPPPLRTSERRSVLLVSPSPGYLFDQFPSTSGSNTLVSKININILFWPVLCPGK